MHNITFDFINDFFFSLQTQIQKYKTQASDQSKEIERYVAGKSWKKHGEKKMQIKDKPFNVKYKTIQTTLMNLYLLAFDFWTKNFPFLFILELIIGNLIVFRSACWKVLLCVSVDILSIIKSIYNREIL